MVTWSMRSPKSVTKDDGVESGTAKFKYDDAGRQTRRTITDEVTGKVTTEVLTWDVASNLVSSVVDDGSHYDYWTYVYDASGQRWAKIEHPTDVTLPTQATVYLGDTEITDTDTFADGAHDVTAVRYFTFGGSTVALEQATEVAAGDPVDDVPFFYLFGDYQGSSQLMMSNETDPSTATIQRNAYTPYGSQRALNTDLSDDSPDVTFDASLSIERGWLSQVADEATSSLGTGLTYLNARYYDPVTSRFLSPDPMLDVMDPKTLDPYRYAENNPVFYTDATGLAPSCGGFWDGLRVAGSGTECTQGNLYAAGAFARGWQDGYSNKWGETVHSFSWTGQLEQAQAARDDPIGAVVNNLAASPIGAPISMVQHAMHWGGIAATAEQDPGLGSPYAAGAVLGDFSAEADQDAAAVALVVLGPEVAGLARTGAGRIANSQSYFRPAYRYNSQSSLAKQIRAGAIGKPCAKCGETMVPGTKTAPWVEHSPPLRTVHEVFGRYLTSDAKATVANSSRFIKDANCKACQLSQGGGISQMSSWQLWGTFFREFLTTAKVPK